MCRGRRRIALAPTARIFASASRFVTAVRRDRLDGARNVRQNRIGNWTVNPFGTRCAIEALLAFTSIGAFASIMAFTSIRPIATILPIVAIAPLFAGFTRLGVAITTLLPIGIVRPALVAAMPPRTAVVVALSAMLSLRLMLAMGLLLGLLRRGLALEYAGLRLLPANLLLALDTAEPFAGPVDVIVAVFRSIGRGH